MTVPRAFLAMLVLAAAGSALLLRLTDPARRPETAVAVAPGEAAPVVLAGHAVTLWLGRELAAGTGWDVRPAWPAGLPRGEEQAWAAEQPAEWAARARGAAAVLSLRATLAEDTLYAAVRAHRPQATEIEATLAADLRTPVVRRRPGGEEAGRAALLAPGNAARLAERIAAELTALRPEAEARVVENLRRVQARLFALRAAAARRLADGAAETAVFAPWFDDFLAEAGVQVIARVEGDEARWSETEVKAWSQRLREVGARVSVHAAPPGARTRAALAAAGVRPVVLDALRRTPGREDDYIVALERNLDALAIALGGGAVP